MRRLASFLLRNRKPSRRVLCLERLEDRSLLTSGLLDSTFGAGGKVTTDIGGESFDLVNGMVIQSDGKIVVSGGSNATPIGFRIARYNEDGTLDTSFSTGIVAVAGDLSNGAGTMVLQSDGKVVLVGSDNLAGTNFDFIIVRLNGDGTLDSSFGSGGQQRIDFGDYDIAQGVTVQADGRIVVVGYSTASKPDGQFALARLNTDGSLDQTFDGDGKLTFDFNSCNQGAYGVVVQPDGNIVVCGYIYDGEGRQHAAVARLTSNGEFDASFGTDGKQSIEDYGSFAGALSLQPNGEIVMVGYDYHNDIAVIRLNGDGQLDTSFNGSGTQTIDFNNGYDSATGVAILPNGKIVVVGTTNPGVDPSFNNMIVARLNGDGSLDYGFGSGGIEVIDFGGYDFGSGIAIQPDGKIVVGGTADQPNTGSDFAVARLTGDGGVEPNDPPIIIKECDLDATDESGPQRIPGFAILPPSVAAASQPHFRVSTDKPHLFTQPPALDAVGELTYTPRPNANGEANVVVELLNADGTLADESLAFTIVVSKPHPFLNATNSLDVDNNSIISLLDALFVINRLNEHVVHRVDSSELPQPLLISETSSLPSLYCDVNGDGQFSPIDALLVINYFDKTRLASPAEGESASSNPAFEHAPAAIDALELVALDLVQNRESKRRRQ